MALENRKKIPKRYTGVRIDEPVKIRAQKIADKIKISFSDVIREALDRCLPEMEEEAGILPDS